MDEIDAGNARIQQLENQLSTKQESLKLMQANLHSYEAKIATLEHDSSDKQSQIELNKRQNLRLNEEIDQVNANNSALRRENEYVLSLNHFSSMFSA